MSQNIAHKVLYDTTQLLPIYRYIDIWIITYSDLKYMRIIEYIDIWILEYTGRGTLEKVN